MESLNCLIIKTTVTSHCVYNVYFCCYLLKIALPIMVLCTKESNPHNMLCIEDSTANLTVLLSTEESNPHNMLSIEDSTSHLIVLLSTEDSNPHNMLSIEDRIISLKVLLSTENGTCLPGIFYRMVRVISCYLL